MSEQEAPVDPKVELTEKLAKAEAQLETGKIQLKRIHKGQYETWDGEYVATREYTKKDDAGQEGVAGVIWWLRDKNGNEVGDPRHDRLKDIKIAILSDRVSVLKAQLAKLK